MSTAAARLGAGAPGMDELERRACEARRGGREVLGTRWASLTLAEHLLAVGADELDGATAQPLPVPLLEALARIRQALGGGRWPLPRDGLARVLESCVEALERIVASPRWRPQRVRVRLQPEKVRQQDVKCLVWLARQPGVTLHEKSASARQVLGVVRQRNTDTAENRLVVRVLLALERLVRQRLEACERGEFEPRAAHLHQALVRMRQLIRRELESSPMAGVAPSLRPEPNNVLLGDPDYSRVWRAFRWLGSRDELAARMWARGDSRLTAALGAAVLATLAGRREVVAEDVRATVDLGADGLGLDVPRMALVAAGARERVTLLMLEPPGQEGWRIEQRVLAGAPFLEPLETSTLLLTATLEDALEPVPGRGALARAVIRAGQGEASLDFHADAEGLQGIARALVERWLGPEPDAAAALLLPAEVTAARSDEPRVGWDLSTPQLRVATSQGCSGPGGLALVGRRCPREGCFVGAQGLSLLGDAPSLGGPELLVRRGGGDGEPGRTEEARTVVAALFRQALATGAGPAPGGSLALVVPDGMDELATRLLREALPASQAGALFVPSSVAAALEWRRRQGNPPGIPAEPVLVFNAHAPGLSVTYLELLGDTQHADARDPFVWQRALPLEPLVEASQASATAWALALAREAVQRASGDSLEEALRHKAAARLVDGGLLAALLDDEAARPVLVPLAEDGSRWLAVERRHVEPAMAAPVWLEALRRWLEALERSGDMERLRTQVQGRPLVLLLAGEPFEQPALQEAIRAELSRRFGASRIEVLAGGAGALAMGAREALVRRGLGEPTWSDTLPPLRLEVSTERGPEWFELLEGTRQVRPGERVEVSIARVLVLPAHERRIAFPLSRERGAQRARAGFIAVLEDECLPLGQPARVRLKVDFNYAQDAFRIQVLPVDTAPFTRLEFRWEPGARDAREEIRNEPPGAPELSPWDEAAPEVDTFKQRVGQLSVQCRALFRGNVIADIQDVNKRNRFVEGVRRLVPEVSAEGLGIKDLWRGARGPGAPGRIASALQEALPLLLELGGLEQEPSKGGRKGPPLTKPSLWTNKLVAAELDKLRVAALATLGGLRADAPGPVLPALLERARHSPGSQPLLEAMGRQLASSDRRAVAEALHWLIGQLTPGGARPQALKLPLWALATGLWSTPSAVTALSQEESSRLAACCEAVLERLVTQWHAERVGADLCAEVLVVLLGLMRLRPGVGEPRLVAGTPEAERLAITVERATAALVKVGRPPTPRLRLAPEETLCDMVCRALRGQRLVRVQALED